MGSLRVDKSYFQHKAPSVQECRQGGDSPGYEYGGGGAAVGMGDLRGLSNLTQVLPHTAAQRRVTQPHRQQWELLCSTSAQREQSSGGCRQRSPCRGGDPRRRSPGSVPSLGSSAPKWPASARCGREKGEVGCAQGRARHARGSRRRTEPLPQL